MANPLPYSVQTGFDRGAVQTTIDRQPANVGNPWAALAQYTRNYRQPAQMQAQALGPRAEAGPQPTGERPSAQTTDPLYGLKLEDQAAQIQSKLAAPLDFHTTPMAMGFGYTGLTDPSNMNAYQRQAYLPGGSTIQTKKKETSQRYDTQGNLIGTSQAEEQ